MIHDIHEAIFDDARIDQTIAEILPANIWKDHSAEMRLQFRQNRTRYLEWLHRNEPLYYLSRNHNGNGTNQEVALVS